MTVISGQMAWARAAFANMRCGIVYRLVGPDDHVENIVKAKWCGDVEAVVGPKAHTQCMHNRCVARKGLVGAAAFRYGPSLDDHVLCARSDATSPNYGLLRRPSHLE